MAAHTYVHITNASLVFGALVKMMKKTFGNHWRLEPISRPESIQTNNNSFVD